jgi:hypothetical protein
MGLWWNCDEIVMRFVMRLIETLKTCNCTLSLHIISPNWMMNDSDLLKVNDSDFHKIYWIINDSDLLKNDEDYWWWMIQIIHKIYW